MLNPGIKAILEVCWRQGDKKAFFGLENNELRTFFWIRHFLVDVILGGKIFAGFFKYCLINEQECFIGFKTTRRSRVVLDPIKHDLRVY